MFLIQFEAYASPLPDEKLQGRFSPSKHCFYYILMDPPSRVLTCNKGYCPLSFLMLVSYFSMKAWFLVIKKKKKKEKYWLKREIVEATLISQLPN